MTAPSARAPRMVSVLTENWTPRDFTPSPEMFAEWAVVGGIDGITRRQKQGA